MGPKRIICLTEKTTGTLYLLGEQDRIVGISDRKRAGKSPKCPRSAARKPTRSLLSNPIRCRAFPICRPISPCTYSTSGSVVGIFDMIGTVGALVKPTALTDGVRQMHAIAHRWTEEQG